MHGSVFCRLMVRFDCHVMLVGEESVQGIDYITTYQRRESTILLMVVTSYCKQEFLNDRLQEGFLQRIRYAMKPDEQYGLVFSWDNVVVNFQTLAVCNMDLFDDAGFFYLNAGYRAGIFIQSG